MLRVASLETQHCITCKINTFGFFITCSDKSRLTIASALFDVEDDVVLARLRLAQLSVDCHNHQLVQQHEQNFRQQHSTAVEFPEPHSLRGVQ